MTDDTKTFDAAGFAANLEAAIGGPDGICLVERIEFEALAGGRFRWTIWRSGGRRFVAPGGPEDLPGYLAATRIILEAQAGIAPEIIRQEAYPNGKTVE